MHYVNAFDCNQMVMTTWDSMVVPDSTARLIDAFVKSLNLHMYFIQLSRSDINFERNISGIFDAKRGASLARNLECSLMAIPLEMSVIGLTGITGGELASFSDMIVKVPETETYRIQELHLPIYHCWCMML